MALDGIYLNLLTRELNDRLTGSRVEKIHQPSKQDFILRLKNHGESFSLLLSASGSNPRICITDHSPENPDKPPMLCMLFRKHLLGAVLLGLRQEGTDRILYLDFDATNELGDRVKRTLVLEIMAQYSNLILIDEAGTVIDSVKRVDLLTSSVRQILPGLTYCLPPRQNKPSLLNTNPANIVDAITSSDKKLSSGILSSIEGVSPLTAREIAFRVSADDITANALNEIQRELLIRELQTISDMLTGKIPVTPTILTDENNNPCDYSFREITQYGGLRHNRTVDSLSYILDEFYYEKERLIRTKNRADDLFRLLSSLTDRTARKLNSQRAELTASMDREQKRIYAELINANLFRLKGINADFYEVEDYYNNCEIVKIPARPELSPEKNAQRYFKEYRKAQTAEKILTEQIEKGERDLDYLASVTDALTRADTEKEFSAIRDELSETGFLKKKTATKKKSAALPPIEYTSPGGFKILVGRNNIQNDKLTHRIAAKSDIWFHTQKIHGSHVILVTEGRTPAGEDMEFAAALAAYHSSARTSKLVPVDYTEVKNIKKPGGANPGFVIYHVYKTIIIDPYEK